MTTTTSLRDRIDAIVAKWGTKADSVPHQAVWDAIAQCAEDQPLTLVNHFKMRETASYEAGHAEAGSGLTGQEAFQRFGAVSMPGLEQVGGRFLMVAPFMGSFIGAAEDWDLVAIGSYPNPGALLALFEMDAYREAYAHRVAACADQRVSLCLG